MRVFLQPGIIPHKAILTVAQLSCGMHAKTASRSRDEARHHDTDDGLRDFDHTLM